MDNMASLPQQRGNPKGILAGITLISAVGIGLSLAIPLLSLTLDARGISSSWIGINTAFAGVASVCMTPFVTPLARKYGTGRLLIAAAIIATLVLPAFHYASFPLWFPLRLIYSGALAILFVLSEFWINASAPPNKRGLIMGIYATVLSLGFAAGPAVLSFIGTEGILPFLVGAILTGIATIPAVLARSAVPNLAGAPRERIKRYLTAAPLATAAGMVFGALEASTFALLPLYATDTGRSNEEAAFIVSMTGFGNVLLQVPMGLLADRIDKRLLLGICGALTALGILAMPLVLDLAYGLEILVFITFGIAGAIYTVGLTHLGARFTGHELAGANAAFVMMYSIGLLAGPPLVGIAMDSFGGSGFSVSLGGLMAVFAVFAAARLIAVHRRA